MAELRSAIFWVLCPKQSLHCYILSKNIESLIGLQQDNLQKGNPKNVVVVNWDRLVNIYGQGSNDENITFYSCNAQLVYGQRSVNTTNPVFTQIT